MGDFHHCCESRKDRPIRKRLGPPDTFPQEEKQIEVGIITHTCTY